MKALLKELLYIHSLFSFMLYLVGNLIVIITLEYKVKNPYIKHTIAGFFCIALSGFSAYLIPVYFFKNLSPIAMQLLGIGAAFIVQGIFWVAWFKKRFREFAPALAIAFGLTALIAIGMYFAFMWYIKMVVKGAIESAGPLTRRIISFF